MLGRLIVTVSFTKIIEIQSLHEEQDFIRTDVMYGILMFCAYVLLCLESFSACLILGSFMLSI